MTLDPPPYTLNSPFFALNMPLTPFSKSLCTIVLTKTKLKSVFFFYFVALPPLLITVGAEGKLLVI